MRVSTINGAVGSEVLTLGVAFPSTPNPWREFAAANFAPQAGSAQKIATDDARIYSVVYRNGSLWATHTVFYPAAGPTRSSIQAWELDATSFAVKQRMTIDDTTGQNFHAYPSLAVREVCGDDALYAGDADGMAAHLAHLLDDPAFRAAQSEAGRARAARYSWEQCAREHLRAYTLALE